MKTTGIVRHVDELGRIVLPMELRRTFGINVRDSIEISVEGERIILTKYARTCVLCGGAHADNIECKGKLMCHECFDELIENRADLSNATTPDAHAPTIAIPQTSPSSDEPLSTPVVSA